MKTKFISLPVLSAQIEQRLEDHNVKFNSIHKFVFKTIREFEQEDGVVFNSFINKLIYHHKLGIDSLLFEEKGDLFINPNLLVYILQRRLKDFDLDLLRNLNYDIFITSDHIICNNRLGFSLDFFKKFIELKEEDFKLLIRPIEVTKNCDYFDIIDFKNYLKFKYEQNRNDDNVIRAISNLMSFVFNNCLNLYNYNNAIFRVDNVDVDYESFDLFLNGGKLFVSCSNTVEKTNKKSKRDVKVENVKSKSKNKGFKNEAYYQLKLYRLHRGEMEVKTPVGNIDLLTTDKLFEVKSYESWKSAVGQLVSYGMFYPDHKKVMALFNKKNKSDDKEIKMVCNSLNIELIYL